MQCPVCKKKVAFKSKEMPFCSERCRSIDLGNWADEKYVISTPAQQNQFTGELEPNNEEFFDITDPERRLQ